MTPREKAEELVNKMFGETPIRATAKEVNEDYETSKRCALIAVNEFLSFQGNLYITDGSLAYQYWQEVKNEINQL